jgi:hypothetical protein
MSRTIPAFFLCFLLSGCVTRFKELVPPIKQAPPEASSGSLDYGIAELEETLTHTSSRAERIRILIESLTF